VKLESLVPIRRRAEFLPRFPAGAEPVVGGAFLGVLEYLVGFPDLLEARLRIGLLADVRMILAGKFPLGALDLVRGRITRHAEYLVIVFEFHGRSC